MPVGPEHAGRRYPPTPPYEVSRAKIDELLDVLGDRTPRADDDVVAPPTFLAVVARRTWDALFDDPELDLALRRVVHADQSFEFVRPLRPGEHVVGELRIDKVRNRGPVDWVTVSADVRTNGGEPVGTVTSTLVHTRTESR